MLHDPTWGSDGPSCRVQGHSPTLGALMRFFFQTSTTRSYSLMKLSQASMRGAEIWPIWQQHHLIACFWQSLKSIFHMRAMQLPGDGLYPSLLIKVLAYLLALRMNTQRAFAKLPITQIMRHLSRHHELRDCMTTHFHDTFSIT
jgi:hypothetical protein